MTIMKTLQHVQHTFHIVTTHDYQCENEENKYIEIDGTRVSKTKRLKKNIENNKGITTYHLSGIQ